MWKCQEVGVQNLIYKPTNIGKKILFLKCVTLPIATQKFAKMG